MDREISDDKVCEGAIELGARIRAARAYAGHSQGSLAAALGMSRTTYKRLERGTRLPSMDEQHVIAETCGVPLDFLVVGFAAESERRDLLIALLRSLDDRFDAMVAEVVHTMLRTATPREASSTRRSRSRGVGRPEVPQPRS